MYYSNIQNCKRKASTTFWPFFPKKINDSSCNYLFKLKKSPIWEQKMSVDNSLQEFPIDAILSKRDIHIVKCKSLHALLGLQRIMRCNVFSLSLQESGRMSEASDSTQTPISDPTPYFVLYVFDRDHIRGTKRSWETVGVVLSHIHHRHTCCVKTCVVLLEELQLYWGCATNMNDIRTKTWSLCTTAFTRWRKT